MSAARAEFLAGKRGHKASRLAKRFHAAVKYHKDTGGTPRIIQAGKTNATSTSQTQDANSTQTEGRLVLNGRTFLDSDALKRELMDAGFQNGHVSVRVNGDLRFARTQLKIGECRTFQHQSHESPIIVTEEGQVDGHSNIIEISKI